MNDAHDYAQVFLDGKYIGKLDRRNGEKQLEFPACPKGARLDILVEAMGRINFGRAIKDFKGITQSVELTVDIDGRPFTCNLKDWEVYNLEDTYDFYKNMKFQPIGSLKDELGQRIPGCYRATFKVNKPSDTFRKLRDLGQGTCLRQRARHGTHLGNRPATDPLHPGMLVEER